MLKEKVRNKRNTRKSSIQGRIQFTVSLLLGVSVITLAVISTVLSFISTFDTLENDMTELAAIAAERVSQELQTTTRIVNELGTLQRMANPDISPEQKQEIINQKVQQYGYARGKFISANGICEYDGTDYNDRDYFIRSMKGETVISNPLISKTDGKLTIMISAPVWKDGIVNTTVVGVVFLAPDSQFLNEIVASISISENSGCYMINSGGTTVAHNTPSVAESQENTIEMAKTDSSLKALAELETQMINGKNGYGTYSYGGVTKIMAYAPVADTDGWSLAITAPVFDFLTSTIVCAVIALMIAIASVIAGILIAKKISIAIGKPIAVCTERISLLSQGDLHTPVPVVDTEDETRVLADATGSLVQSLGVVMADIDSLLDEMSRGNFALTSDKDTYYVGDFRGIIESVHRLNQRLNHTLLNIQEGVGQVNLGALQMAQTAQALAEGATDQAGAVEELQATINNVTGIVEEGAKSLNESYNHAKEYEEQAIASGAEMKDLTAAMQRIDETSHQIGNIIAEIEDIASQTNLLSLNAAVEAARAGDAGRGFAVVAEQIRKLADDSAQSAVHTRELIETSMSEIARGNQITDRTSESLMRVVDGMEAIARDMQESMESSRAQAEAMLQIEQGIEQISLVVQSNSATAEESSATSQELSAQASNMNEMVEAFKLKKD